MSSVEIGWHASGSTDCTTYRARASGSKKLQPFAVFWIGHQMVFLATAIVIVAGAKPPYC